MEGIGDALLRLPGEVARDRLLPLMKEVDRESPRFLDDRVHPGAAVDTDDDQEGIERQACEGIRGHAVHVFTDAHRHHGDAGGEQPAHTPELARVNPFTHWRPPGRSAAPYWAHRPDAGTGGCALSAAPFRNRNRGRSSCGSDHRRNSARIVPVARQTPSRQHPRRGGRAGRALCRPHSPPADIW